MSSSRLRLNPTKTDFLWIATSRRRHLIDRYGADIKPTTCVKLLGVLVDDDLSLKTPVSKTVSTRFYQLRQINAIYRCLPTDAVKSLVNAFVVSRLDDCNGIYANLSGIHLDRLQSVLNASARLIFEDSRFEHIIQLLRDRLHWLRCPERIQFKLCVYNIYARR